MGDEQVLAIAQQIWDAVECQKIAVCYYRDYGFYSMDIAVGVAIGHKEQRQQQKKCDKIHDLVHGMGYFMANDDYEHPENIIDGFPVHICMSGDFGMRDDDPNRIKLFIAAQDGQRQSRSDFIHQKMRERNLSRENEIQKDVK